MLIMCRKLLLRCCPQEPLEKTTYFLLHVATVCRGTLRELTSESLWKSAGISPVVLALVGISFTCIFGEIFGVCQWIFENEIEIAPFVILVVLKIMSWSATVKNFTPRICCLEDWHLANLFECADAAQCALYSGMFLTPDALGTEIRASAQCFPRSYFLPELTLCHVNVLCNAMWPFFFFTFCSYHC